MENEPRGEQNEETTAITDLIEFPLAFDFAFGKIYDARRREVATVKTIASSDERRRILGDWMCESMNAYREAEQEF